MYSVQADMIATYHMTDPVIFYNKEDVWEIPTEIYGTEPAKTVPYYQTLAFPGQTEPEFALLLPFTPLSKQNMSSLLVARQDGDSYGKLATLDFPKDKLIFGPAQIEARISNEPDISAQLTLWDQSGSKVIRGNLLVVPIGNSVMYFEPLYLQATQSPIPELTRVIVAYGDKVAMEPTLAEAVVKVLGGTGTGSTTTTTQGTTSTTTPGATTTTSTPGATTTTTTPGPVTTLPSDPAALATLANALYNQAIEAQRRGDWAEYGRVIDQLGIVLEALLAAQGRQ
jgi:hypothetical protein